MILRLDFVAIVVEDQEGKRKGYLSYRKVFFVTKEKHCSPSNVGYPQFERPGVLLLVSCAVDGQQASWSFSLLIHHT